MLSNLAVKRPVQNDTIHHTLREDGDIAAVPTVKRKCRYLLTETTTYIKPK